MLQRVSNLLGASVQAVDGGAGEVHDLLFDDETWRVSYLVVDTGPWILGRRVLVAPQAVPPMAPGEDALRVELTREQIEGSPDVDVAPPVSLQQIAALHRYYGWPPYVYWSTTSTVASDTAEETLPEPAEGESGEDWPLPEGHLRSARELEGYRLTALDGEAGTVEDVSVDDAGWVVRYLLVRLDEAVEGRDEPAADARRVLVDAAAVTEIEWENECIGVDLTREALRTSPREDETLAAGRD